MKNFSLSGNNATTANRDDQGWFYLIGDMTNPQNVRGRVLRFKLTRPP